jgi:pyruvate/2-oxoglutarate dehydrogenase complex dihydrolipoamide acyltransferase (E2) component
VSRVDVILPKWGLTMEDGAVVAWHVSVGDAVTEGQVIAEVETEKVENELTAPCDGTIVELVAEEDEIVDVGGLLAVIESGD